MLGGGMELRHLRYFVAVAEEENITRAAARLRISQPPLSRQIKDLEENLGVTLFERDARAVRLTAAGAEFLDEARAILRRIDRSLARFTAKYGGTNGGIHVGFAPSLTTRILPLALRKFEAAMPGVRVHLHDMTTEEMLKGLCEDRLHVALVIGNKIKPPGTLRVEELARFAVCVALGRDHALAVSPEIGLRQLAGERLIAYSKNDYPEYHTWLKETFGTIRRRPKISEEYDSSAGVIAAVEAGRGVALVQEGFEEAAGRRVIVRPTNPTPSPFVLAIAYKRSGLCPIGRAFLEAARGASASRLT